MLIDNTAIGEVWIEKKNKQINSVRSKMVAQHSADDIKMMNDQTESHLCFKRQRREKFTFTHWTIQHKVSICIQK